MCFNLNVKISTLHGKPLKLVNQFIYLGSNISSNKNDFNILMDKAWTAAGRLTTIWKSDLPHKIKWEFFQVAAVLILLYDCTTYNQTKRLEKKREGNHTMMMRAILNKSWKQHRTAAVLPLAFHLTNSDGIFHLC